MTRGVALGGEVFLSARCNARPFYASLAMSSFLLQFAVSGEATAYAVPMALLPPLPFFFLALALPPVQPSPLRRFDKGLGRTQKTRCMDDLTRRYPSFTSLDQILRYISSPMFRQDHWTIWLFLVSNLLGNMIDRSGRL